MEVQELLKWESHIITVIFSTIVTGVAAYFVLVTYGKKTQLLEAQIYYRQLIEDELKLDEEKLDPAIRLACPICNSRDVIQKSNLLGIVYRILKIKETITRQNECNRCGYSWEEELI